MSPDAEKLFAEWDRRYNCSDAGDWIMWGLGLVGGFAFGMAFAKLVL